VLFSYLLPTPPPSLPISVLFTGTYGEDEYFTYLATTASTAPPSTVKLRFDSSLAHKLPLVQHAQHYHVVVHVVSHPLASIAAAIFDDDWYIKAARFFPKLGEDLHLPTRNRALRVLTYWVATNTLLETSPSAFVSTNWPQQLRLPIHLGSTCSPILNCKLLSALSRPNWAWHACPGETSSLSLVCWRSRQVCDMAQRYGYAPSERAVNEHLANCGYEWALKLTAEC
jgi:hypothetical protein